MKTHAMLSSTKSCKQHQMQILLLIITVDDRRRLSSLPQQIDLLFAHLKSVSTQSVYRVYGGQLTIGARSDTPIANATTVKSSWSLEKFLPRTSNAWLGVARVPKMSLPKAKTRLVLSRRVGREITVWMPATSRECVRYHWPSKTRKGV